MIGGFRCDNNCRYVWSENQEWDDKTVEQLRKEYHIFYDRSSHIAVMLEGFSKKHGGMVVLGFEYKAAFHSRMLPAVLKELHDAYEYTKARG